MNITEFSHSIPIQYYLYVIQGFFIFFFNSLIVVAILRSSLNQSKEYLVVCGLACADVALKLAYHVSGIHRLILIYRKQDQLLLTSWECMKHFHSALLIFSTPLASLLLMCTSVDRFLSISVPVWYYKATRRYAFTLVASFYSFSFVNSFVFVFLSFSKHNSAGQYSAICLSSASLGKGLTSEYYYYLRSLPGMFSVLIYVAIPFIYKVKGRSSGQGQVAKIKRQRKLIKTLGISAIFTFIFFVIPNIVRAYFSNILPQDLWNVMAPYGSCVQNINPLINFFLYTLRHKDLKDATRKLFTCHSISSTNAVSPAEADRRNRKRIPKKKPDK